ncbi:uracil-DNA glycosylase [Halarcobacter mediterraneus]|uniref:Uracil-DNA glycosylase n=1 Tax=Halarcobacter mediterraneus TaxID=2023153 RepID=A0A4Q1AX81_9BACT|nr:uracil-DNA glycosylase [Halarcobacter mediterraneus]RXK14358.1 uracil-DNA glycosylase [Halarcobacter mediterraneus]
MEERIICQKCKFYFVTWQPAKPHGCKAYGFKSKMLPSIVVKNSSGFPCSFFQFKKPHNK